jgi:hypothetical protein
MPRLTTSSEGTLGCCHNLYPIGRKIREPEGAGTIAQVVGVAVEIGRSAGW